MTCNSNIRNFFNYRTGIIVIIGIYFVISCKKPPEYPDVPVLTEVTTEEFVPGVPTDSVPDTIKLGVYFRDGNGDLGLEESDIGIYPYHEYVFVLDGSGNKIEYGSAGAPPDTLCNYKEDDDGKLYLIDKNEAFYNILIDMYRQNADGSYSKMNLCIPFSGQFPPIYQDNREEVLEGTINYYITSYFFPKGYVKFKISILDRALNKSNEIETSPILIK